MKKNASLAELRAANQTRLTTIESIESTRAAGSVSPPAVLAYKQRLLDLGWVYEIPSHEWVALDGARGRVGWTADDGETNCWVHDTSRTPIHSRNEGDLR